MIVAKRDALNQKQCGALMYTPEVLSLWGELVYLTIPPCGSQLEMPFDRENQGRLRCRSGLFA